MENNIEIQDNYKFKINSTYSKDNIINTFKLFIYIFDSFNRLLENSFFEVIDKKENTVNITLIPPHY